MSFETIYNAMRKQAKVNGCNKIAAMLGRLAQRQAKQDGHCIRRSETSSKTSRQGR